MKRRKVLSIIGCVMLISGMLFGCDRQESVENRGNNGEVIAQEKGGCNKRTSQSIHSATEIGSEMMNST